MSKDKPKRTRVYVTIDVECAEERIVNGRPQPPLGYDVRVWGRFENHRRELGIRLIMDELDAFGFRGTFFIEALGATYFGEGELKSVCDAVRSRGHDVQLHLHPIQRRPDYRSRGERPLSDDMACYSVDEQAAMLAEGLDVLARCNVPRDSLLAFRAGNFGANNDTWEAMRRVGLRVSSNLNTCYLPLNCKIRWPRAEPSVFDTGSGVWELPISNLIEPDGTPRHLQVLAVSGAEMVSYLKQARHADITDVVVLTHSFEFFVTVPGGTQAEMAWFNLARLRKLLRFLHQHRSEFVVETVGDAARELPWLPPAAGRVARIPRSSPVLFEIRMLQQRLKRFATERARARMSRARAHV